MCARSCEAAPCPALGSPGCDLDHTSLDIFRGQFAVTAVQPDNGDAWMATEDSDPTPPSLCDFCHCDTVVWQTEQFRFSQRTNRGTVRCEVSLPIGHCDTCGSVRLEDEVEALIEEGVLMVLSRIRSDNGATLCPP